MSVFGSLADIAARLRGARFSPENGHSQLRLECPLSAESSPGEVSQGFVGRTTQLAGFLRQNTGQCMPYEMPRHHHCDERKAADGF